MRDNAPVTQVTIVGGGPGGYEAALVAVQLGATVTLVEQSGLGGSAVLTDCVPSKTLIATAELMSLAAESAPLGVRFSGGGGVSGDDAASGVVSVELAVVNARVRALAHAQSDDIRSYMARGGVRVLSGRGRLAAADAAGAYCAVDVMVDDGSTERVESDLVLLATGAKPRMLAGVVPDGERILDWEQLYDLTELPERLIVVGSGVTGAEFASAYNALGSEVVLVSSRDRVLPGEDADAAQVLEGVFRRRGMTVMGRSRATSVVRNANGVVVTLEDGAVVEGSHCLLAVGSTPNTSDLGLEQAGVHVDDGGFIETDRVSRTSARGIYAAGDCTGVLMLASVAAMQGRIAMWHALGDAVTPLDLRTVSSNVFTDPEIATVGYTQREVDSGEIIANVSMLPLATNARAKMQAITDGFVKLFARPGTSIVVGGVVVAPKASELIFPVAIAVDQRLTVDQLAQTFTVYPSLTGSIAEAARQLHHRG